MTGNIVVGGRKYFEVLYSRQATRISLSLFHDGSREFY